MSKQEDMYVVVNGKEISIKTFKEFIVKDEQIYIHNTDLGLSIAIDIENKEMMDTLGIKKTTI